MAVSCSRALPWVMLLVVGWLTPAARAATEPPPASASAAAPSEPPPSAASSAPAGPQSGAVATSEPPPAPSSVPTLVPLPKKERSWHLGLEALTDFPLQIGGKIWLETPGRIRLSSSLGYLPGFYVDAINGILVGVGAYGQNTADMIRSSLKSSLIFRTHLGWRPIKRRGFYFEVGYTLATLGGGATTSDVVVLFTGLPLPLSGDGNKDYTLTSMVHMIDAEVGWMWLPWRGLTLRAAIGFAGTVAAKSKIERADQQPMNAVEDMFARSGEEKLDKTYTSYVFAPTFTFAIGWRFF